MKSLKFTDGQIGLRLRQVEERVIVGEICRNLGITKKTYYRCRKKYEGLMTSEMKRLSQLEDENHRLQKLVAG